MHMHQYNQQQNYDNNQVEEIRQRLGEFNYGPERNLGDREYRDMIVLENMAKYEGEWIMGTN